MGIISKTVIIMPVGKAFSYYKEKGYDIKYKQRLEVKVEDLSTCSTVLIKVRCDYCDTEKEIRYVDYNAQTKNGTEKCCCLDCVKLKREETMLQKYGHKNSMNIPEFKEKAKNTNLKKYGSVSPSGNKEVREKQKNTLMRNYGVENPSLSKEIQDKRTQTFIDRYGVKNSLLVPEFQEKAKQTNLKRYGVENVFYNKEILAKQKETFYKNGTCITSSQQLYLYNLYNNNSENVMLNYPVRYYNVDICFLDDKFIVEYDGSGHNLNVKFGAMTQEEFNNREIKRFYAIKSEGYKQMRIISKTDKLPSNFILLNLLSYAHDYFQSYPNRSWIEFNIDELIVRSAEFQQGLPFDYGKLRTVSKIG